MLAQYILFCACVWQVVWLPAFYFAAMRFGQERITLDQTVSFAHVNQIVRDWQRAPMASIEVVNVPFDDNEME